MTLEQLTPTDPYALRQAQIRLMTEIHDLSAQIRDLRGRFTRRDRPRDMMRTLEDDLRAKWEELRTIRAGCIPPEPTRRPGGKYWR